MTEPTRAELHVRLALPGGAFDVAAGEVVRLPDDQRYVDALSGRVRGGGHRVTLGGRRLDRRAQAARVRRGLVTVGAGPLAPEVTVSEHLVAVVGRAAAARTLGSAPLLAARGDDPAGVLSGGERRVLDWLVAVAIGPRAAVLDRPATGLDPVSLAWAHETLDRWLDDGVAVLLRVGRTEEERWLTHRADGARRSRGPDPRHDGP